MTTILCSLVGIAICAYIYWQLYRSNMTVPERVEVTLPPRKALEFAIENNIPLK